MLATKALHPKLVLKQVVGVLPNKIPGTVGVAIVIGDDPQQSPVAAVEQA